jgi:DNA-binding transcriptional ArsR family regulator
MTTDPLVDVDPGTDALNTAFSLLRDPRRRSALRYLQSHPSTTVGDLAGYILGGEAAAGDGETVADLSVELKHVHLPKLDDAEVVTYDRSRDHVRRRETAAADVTFDILEAAPARAN